MKKIRVVTTLIQTSEVPFDEEHYPGCTLEEAVAAEEEIDDEPRWLQVLESEGVGIDQKTVVEIIDDELHDGSDGLGTSYPASSIDRLGAVYMVGPGSQGEKAK